MAPYFFGPPLPGDGAPDDWPEREPRGDPDLRSPFANVTQWESGISIPPRPFTVHGAPDSPQTFPTLGAPTQRRTSFTDSNGRVVYLVNGWIEDDENRP